jgi:hypothetical protein
MYVVCFQFNEDQTKKFNITIRILRLSAYQVANQFSITYVSRTVIAEPLDFHCPAIGFLHAVW